MSMLNDKLDFATQNVSRRGASGETLCRSIAAARDLQVSWSAACQCFQSSQPRSYVQVHKLLHKVMLFPMAR